jgi:hypothetical protein
VHALLLSIAQAPSPGALVQPALSTLEKSVIGAVLIVALGVAVLAVWKLLKVQEEITKVQNLRVDDQKDMSKRMEAITERLITTFSKMENALTNLTQAEKDGQVLLQAMKNSQDTLILEAVRGQARAPAGGE